MSYRSEHNDESLATLCSFSIAKDATDTRQSKFFPSIVHAIINEGDDSVIEWVQDGEAFIVKDTEKIGPVLQKYFQHKKYSSFQRQLNMYGWKKYSFGKYKGAFHHPSFHRDKAKADFSLIRRKGPPNETTRKRKQPTQVISSKYILPISDSENRFHFRNEFHVKSKLNDWTNLPSHVGSSECTKKTKSIILSDNIQIGSPNLVRMHKRIPLQVIINNDNLTISSTVLSPRVITKNAASNRIKMLATAATCVRDIEKRTGLHMV